MKTLTVEWLKEHDACEDKTKIFAKLFPNGMEFTLRNCRKLENHRIEDMDFNWLFTTIKTGKDRPMVMWGYVPGFPQDDTPKYFMQCLRKLWKEECK